MTLQPDDPGRPERSGEDGVGAPHEAAPEPDLDELTSLDERTEPAWVLPAIVLAMVALSGSLLLFVTVGLAALTLWVLSTPPTQPPEQRDDPFRYPLGGPFGGGGLVP